MTELQRVLEQVEGPCVVGDSLQVHVRSLQQQDGGMVRYHVAIAVARSEGRCIQHGDALNFGAWNFYLNVEN